MASNVTRTSSLQKVHKRYGERLGTKVSKKLNAEKLTYDVRVHAMVPVDVVGHILAVTAEHVQMHNIRKSGSQKMDVSFIDMSTVFSIEGKKGELGQVRVIRENVIAEYKGVTVKTSGKMFALTDGNGDTFFVNTAVDGVRVEIAADADLGAKKKSAPAAKPDAKKDTKKVKKSSKKVSKKPRGDDDDF